jgi:hypothetical protein
MSDANAKLTEQIQGLLIPPEYVDVSKEKVERMKTQWYVLIGMAVVLFGVWGWLLYQSFVETEFGLGYRFWFLAAAGMVGLVFYAVFYFAKALSAEDLSKEKEADSVWQRIKQFVSQSAVDEAEYRKQYFEARKEFLVALNWVLMLTLAFSIVSLALVIHVLWNPMQYLPPMPSMNLPQIQIQMAPGKPVKMQRHKK